ncbi:FAD binding domain-containing protein [Mycolicibacterium litorale]|uniref:FAD binding domain-containing protein n=1 Tax=Mycolicibacterium litorale TaxID=758802 RepID=UPI003CE9760F
MTGVQYARPTSTSEAIEALRSDDAARMIAGGTDLMVQMRLGHRRPSLVVDTAGLTELHQLDCGPASVIGAATTLRTMLGEPGLVKQYTALAQSANLLGGRQIQAVATFGGNVCNASPAAETATPLLAYDAEVEIAGPDGVRVVALRDFFTGPGETALARGELLVAFRLPASAGIRRSAYRRLQLRRSVDIAVVSASACVDIVDERIAHARVAIGAVNAVPTIVDEAAAALEGVSMAAADADVRRDAIAVAAAACRSASRPIDDVRASSRYRSAMVEVIVARVLGDVLGVG